MDIIENYPRSIKPTLELNPHYIHSLIDPTIKTVGVRFNNGQTDYTYKTDLKLKLGNKVLIRNRHGNFQVVAVSRIDTQPKLERFSSIDYQWILEKVSVKRYKRRLKMDKATIQEIKDHLIETQRNDDKDELKELGYHFS